MISAAERFPKVVMTASITFGRTGEMDCVFVALTAKLSSTSELT
jgi:hypothetical protein